jgi:predicted RND superfamily exporter protein
VASARISPGFGLERLGLVSLRHPRLILAVALVLVAVSVVGRTQLGFDSDLREIIRSNDRDFVRLLKLSRQYSTSEFDVLLVVEGGALFRRQALERLRAMHLDLRFAPGVTQVLSIFSARRPLSPDGKSRPVIPSDLSALTDVRALKAALIRDPFVSGALLSKEGDVAVFVIGLDRQPRNLDETRAIIRNIAKISAGAVAPLGLRSSLTGVPVMRVEIIGALKRNQIVFVAAGLLLGLAVAWLFFGRLRHVAIVGLPSVVATLWLYGVMWAIDQDFNSLTNVVPALVVVLCLADSLHLLFAILRQREAGAAVRQAIEAAVRGVGPACVLTSLTTALAMASLLLVPEPFISGFGLAAAAGAILAYAATMTIVPPLALLLLHGGDAGPGRSAGARLVQASIRAASDGITRFVLKRPKTIGGGGGLLVIILVGLHALNASHFIYSDYLPSSDPALKAMRTVEEKLAGTSMLGILLEWPPGQGPLSAEGLALIRRAHRILASEPRIRHVWSLDAITDQLGRAGAGRAAVLDYLKKIQAGLERRVISTADRSALVAGQLVELDAAVLLPMLSRLEDRIAELRARNPAVEMSLTGFAAVSARSLHRIIMQPNRSLLLTIIAVVGLIGVALRSLKVCAVIILPNLLPIAAAGAFLYVTGFGLQLTSVVAFTIGFGIAVDSTIHVLLHHRAASASHGDPEEALRRSLSAVGPVLMVGTLVLACGFGATMVSDIPIMRLFGGVSVLILAVALAGDMLLLPAMLRLSARPQSRSARSP